MNVFCIKFTLLWIKNYLGTFIKFISLHFYYCLLDSDYKHLVYIIKEISLNLLFFVEEFGQFKPILFHVNKNI